MPFQSASHPDRMVKASELACAFSIPDKDQIRLAGEVPETKRRFDLELVFLAALHFASCWRPLSDISGYLQGHFNLDQRESISIVEDLINAGLMVEGSEPTVDLLSLKRSQQTWTDYGWLEAFYYHSWVRGYPFLDYSVESSREVDAARMREYAALGSPPSTYKDYPDVPTVSLERDWHALPMAGLGELLDPSFTPVPTRTLDILSLGLLLYFSVGETGIIALEDMPPLLLKASPSGGARHPVEAYPVILDVPSIRPGVYHYSVRKHGIELLRSGNFTEEIRQICIGIPNDLPSLSAVIFFTVVVERSMWRYRDPRAYRPTVHDVGHVMQNLWLSATALSIGCLLHHGFRDEAAEQFLGVDGFAEPILHFAALY